MPDFGASIGKPEREKVTVTRVEYGPTPHDTKVILSDGKELSGLQMIQPGRAEPSSLCTVALTAICKEADDA